MKLKTIILAAILVAGFPVAAQAQDAETFDNFQVSCDAGAECNNFDVIYAQQSEDNGISQRTRRRTRRTTSDQKIYFGLTPGLAFLGDGTNVGFGGSIVGGYNFSEQLAAELEIFDYFGGLDDGVADFNSITDDSGYNYLGISANAVYKYPFSQSDANGIYGFGGAGLGYGRFGFTGDFSDILEDRDIDTSLSGFLLNLKLGVGYPVNDKLDLLGQLRYANTFLDEVNNVSFQQDAITIDIGAKLNL